MGQLKHFLGALACSYLGRRARNAPVPRSGGARERRRKHLDRCDECRRRQERERQYLERLRGAGIPAASADLTARLLARTGELAAGDEQGAPRTAPAPGAGPPPQRLPPQPPLRRQAGPLRVAARIAGGVAATTALMGGAAYVMGGSTAMSADNVFAAAFAGPTSVQAQTSGSVSGAAWKLSAAPDVTPAGSLSSEQLAALRARGWSCPELRELGYHLVWARAGVAYGSEVLELRLTDGQHFATVLEQHRIQDPDVSRPAVPVPAPAVPVNLLTGHAASEDGFVAAGPDGAATPQDPGKLWVNSQTPFRAIYRTPTATFTYISDLPAEQADDAVGVLVHPRPGAAAGAPGRGDIPARLERGLERIVELLAP